MLTSGTTAHPPSLLTGISNPSEADTKNLTNTNTATTAISHIKLLSIKQENAPEMVGISFPVFVAKKQILLTLEVPQAFDDAPSLNTVQVKKRNGKSMPYNAHKWLLTKTAQRQANLAISLAGSRGKPYTGTYEIILNRTSLISELMLVKDEDEQRELANGNPIALLEERKDVLYKTSWWQALESKNNAVQTEKGFKKRKIEPTSIDISSKIRVNTTAMPFSLSPFPIPFRGATYISAALTSKETVSPLPGKGNNNHIIAIPCFLPLFSQSSANGEASSSSEEKSNRDIIIEVPLPLLSSSVSNNTVSSDKTHFISLISIEQSYIPKNFNKIFPIFLANTSIVLTINIPLEALKKKEIKIIQKDPNNEEKIFFPARVEFAAASDIKCSQLTIKMFKGKKSGGYYSYDITIEDTRIVQDMFLLREIKQLDSLLNKTRKYHKDRKKLLTGISWWEKFKRLKSIHNAKNLKERVDIYLANEKKKTPSNDQMKTSSNDEMKTPSEKMNISYLIGE